MARIAALNSSCPMPANKFDNAPANIATTQAARTPTSTPPPIHRLRCGTVRVTASTMPMIRPASKTSRKTIMSAAITIASLLNEQRAARDLFVVFVDKFVTAGFLRAHIDRRVAPGGDHLLDLQGLALEFHRLGIQILQLDHDRHIGGGAGFGATTIFFLFSWLGFWRAPGLVP